ncbi:MAG: glycosyltransferase family 4 protein [Planctomycetota bacterium]
MPPAPILFCSHVVELGGAEHVLLDLLERLDRRRFIPHLAAPGAGPLTERAAALGVPTHDVPLAGRSRLQKALAVLRAGRALRRLAARLDCRLLVANSMIAGYAAVRARHAGLAAVWHLHIVTRSRLAATALRRADAVLSPARAALDAAGVGPQGVVVPNGVPERFFAARGDGLRQRLGLTADRPLLGIVGRLDPDKGHDVLLRAIAALPAARRPQLVIAGGELFAGTQPRLGGFAATLRGAVASSGLDAQVHWLGQLTDTAPLLAEIDVLVVPSTAPECAPRTIAEAQAAGCAVIATDVGGVPEMVADQRTGLLVPPGDATALSQAIAQLLGAPSRRAALAAAARERAVAEYRLDTFAERCAAAFAAARPDRTPGAAQP